MAIHERPRTPNIRNDRPDCENRNRLSPKSARLEAGSAQSAPARIERTREKSGSSSPATFGIAGVANSRQIPNASSSAAAAAEERTARAASASGLKIAPS